MVARAVTGHGSVASGYHALYSNTSGDNNVATGFQALQSNTTGIDNLATGTNALQSNVDGHDNVASGFRAMTSNTSGSDNVASGLNALYSNTTGSDNVATGVGALFDSTTAANNVAIGSSALQNDTTGHDNTALGTNALGSTKTGNSNLALGSGAGKNLTTGSYDIELANAGHTGETRTIRIGGGSQTRAFIGGVSGRSNLRSGQDRGDQLKRTVGYEGRLREAEVQLAECKGEQPHPPGSPTGPDDSSAAPGGVCPPLRSNITSVAPQCRKSPNLVSLKRLRKRSSSCRARLALSLS